MSSAKRKSFVLTIIGVCCVLMCESGDIENVTAIGRCETNKDCDKKMECFQNQCLDPCRKSPCGSNAICKAQFHVPLCLCREGYGGSPFLDCNPLNSTEVELEAVTDIDTEPFIDAEHVTESDFQIDTGNAFATNGGDRGVVPDERATESVRQSSIDDVITENIEQSQFTTANPLAFDEKGVELTTDMAFDARANSDSSSTTNSEPPPIDQSISVVTEDDSYLLALATTPRSTSPPSSIGKSTTPKLSATTKSNVQKITKGSQKPSSSTPSNVQKISKISTTSNPTNVQIIVPKSTSKPNLPRHNTKKAWQSSTESTTELTTEEAQSFTISTENITESATVSSESFETTVIVDTTEISTENTTSIASA